MNVKMMDMGSLSLAWAVAKALDLNPRLQCLNAYRGSSAGYSVHIANIVGTRCFSPATHWADAGPLMEQYHIGFEYNVEIEGAKERVIRALMNKDDGYLTHWYAVAHNSLYALCRVIVFKHFGNSADIPDELRAFELAMNAK